jgi:hypothetical protein
LIWHFTGIWMAITSLWLAVFALGGYIFWIYRRIARIECEIKKLMEK